MEAEEWDEEGEEVVVEESDQNEERTVEAEENNSASNDVMSSTLEALNQLIKEARERCDRRMSDCEDGEKDEEAAQGGEDKMEEEGLQEATEEVIVMKDDYSASEGSQEECKSPNKESKKTPRKKKASGKTPKSKNKSEKTPRRLRASERRQSSSDEKTQPLCQDDELLERNDELPEQETELSGVETVLPGAKVQSPKKRAKSSMKGVDRSPLKRTEPPNGEAEIQVIVHSDKEVARSPTLEVIVTPLEELNTPWTEIESPQRGDSGGKAGGKSAKKKLESAKKKMSAESKRKTATEGDESVDEITELEQNPSGSPAREMTSSNEQEQMNTSVKEQDDKVVESPAKKLRSPKKVNSPGRDVRLSPRKIKSPSREARSPMNEAHSAQEEEGTPLLLHESLSPREVNFSKESSVTPTRKRRASPTKRTSNGEMSQGVESPSLKSSVLRAQSSEDEHSLVNEVPESPQEKHQMRKQVTPKPDTESHPSKLRRSGLLSDVAETSDSVQEEEIFSKHSSTMKENESPTVDKRPVRKAASETKSKRLRTSSRRDSDRASGKRTIAVSDQIEVATSESPPEPSNAKDKHLSPTSRYCPHPLRRPPSARLSVPSNLISGETGKQIVITEAAVSKEVQNTSSSVYDISSEVEWSPPKKDYSRVNRMLKAIQAEKASSQHRRINTRHQLSALKAELDETTDEDDLPVVSLVTTPRRSRRVSEMSVESNSSSLSQSGKKRHIVEQIKMEDAKTRRRSLPVTSVSLSHL